MRTTYYLRSGISEVLVGKFTYVGWQGFRPLFQGMTHTLSLLQRLHQPTTCNWLFGALFFIILFEAKPSQYFTRNVCFPFPWNYYEALSLIWFLDVIWCWNVLRFLSIGARKHFYYYDKTKKWWKKYMYMYFHLLLLELYVWDVKMFGI